MIVAFWNVNMGPTSSSHKLRTFAAWLGAQENRIDLLILEEFTDEYHLLTAGNLSFTQILEERGLDPQPIANTTQVTYRGISNSRKRKRSDEGTSSDPVMGQGSSTKSVYAFGRSGQAIRFEDGRNFTMRAADDSLTFAQRRAAVRINVLTGNQLRYVIFGLHANASSRSIGAIEQVGLELERLAERGTPAWAGGDFNHDLLSGLPPTYLPIRPLNWNNAALPFTQWNWKGDNLQETRNTLTALNLNTPNQRRRTIARAIGRHDRILDYLLGLNPNVQGLQNIAPEVVVTALPMCNSNDVTYRILRDFDHFPVVYNIPDPPNA